MATAKELWVENPPSEQIAAELNRTYATACKHNRTPCYLRCGVRRRLDDERWEVIPADERREWKRTL
jgi:hypothetical protein